MLYAVVLTAAIYIHANAQITPTPALNAQRIDQLEHDLRDVQAWRDRITEAGAIIAVQNSADIRELKTTVAALDRTMWLVMSAAIVSFIGMLFQFMTLRQSKNAATKIVTKGR